MSQPGTHHKRSYTCHKRVYASRSARVCAWYASVCVCAWYTSVCTPDTYACMSVCVYLSRTRVHQSRTRVYQSRTCVYLSRTRVYLSQRMLMCTVCVCVYARYVHGTGVCLRVTNHCVCVCLCLCVSVSLSPCVCV